MAWESGYRVYNVMLQVCPKPVEPAALSSEAWLVTSVEQAALGIGTDLPLL